MKVKEKSIQGEVISIGTREAEARYGMPMGSLAQLRFYNKGPKYYKLGKGKNCKIIYMVKDIEEWLFKNQNDPEARR